LNLTPIRCVTAARDATKRPISSRPRLPQCFRSIQSCKLPSVNSLKSGAPDKIRTCDLCLRRAKVSRFGGEAAPTTGRCLCQRHQQERLEVVGELAGGQHVRQLGQERATAECDQRQNALGGLHGASPQADNFAGLILPARPFSSGNSCQSIDVPSISALMALISRTCEALEYITYRPLEEEVDDWNSHRSRRDRTNALERDQCEGMKAAGYEVMNDEQCRPRTAAFSERFGHLR
jgi:hypothetical protein